MHELRSDISFELLDLDALIDDKLEEELVDALEMGPRWVHFFFLVNTRLRKVQVALLDARQGTEDVLLNHLHGLVHVGDDGAHRDFLVGEHGLELLDSIEALGLK